MQKSSPVEKINVVMNVRARKKLRKLITGGFRFPGQKRPLKLPLQEKDAWMYGKGYNCLGNWLIGLDWNGLYPDACRKSSFSIGKGKYIDDKDDLFNIMNDIIDYTYIPIGGGKFRMYVPKSMHNPPLIIKSNKIGNHAPTGYVTGYWSICWVMQAISMGCILHSIKWLFISEKHAMYHTPLYNYICKKKEKYSKSGEKGKRMKFKTLGNSGFGSMLLKDMFPNIYYGNRSKDVISKTNMPNKQIRKKINQYNLTKAPVQNGYQLLGVSKVLMCDLDMKMKSVFTGKCVYGNTDSKYIGIYDLYPKLISKVPLKNIDGKPLEPKLCKKTGRLKNDHGKSLIPDWVFIDMNKYALNFDRLTIEDSNRLSFYEFHWTGVNFFTWEKHIIRYDKDYKKMYKKYNKQLPLIEKDSWMYGYSDTHVNQMFAKRIFKWFCYLCINSHIPDKKYDSNIKIKYNYDDVVFWVKKRVK